MKKRTQIAHRAVDQAGHQERREVTVSSVQAEVQKLMRDTLQAERRGHGNWSTASTTRCRRIRSARSRPISRSVHPMSSATTPTASSAAKITFQLDAWSRTQGKVRICRKIVDAVKDALHGKDLDLADNALVEIRVDFRRVIDDPDGLTKHGLVMVTALVEESAA